MTPADISLLLTAIAGTFSAIFVPLWLRRREDKKKTEELEFQKEKLATEDREKSDATSLISWEKMNSALDRRNADLERRLEMSQQQHRQEIKTIEEDRDRQIAILRARVTELEERVVDLNMQLHRATHGGRIDD